MSEEQIKKMHEEWMSQKITTPTFELKPVEKPDMSPFLVHLTGKNSLVDILKGVGSFATHPNYGFLKASVPPYASEKNYHSPVVCFTETPIFALDFFRLRSFKRFFDDQQYGIGFSKSKLCKVYGVRPVAYFDADINSAVLQLSNLAEDGNLNLPLSEVRNTAISKALVRLKALMFPLFESHDAQGYMWEREWRYPLAQGLRFSYDDIRVICCPSEERADILSQLGAYANEIEVVENWKEYNEVKSFLESKERKLDIGIPLDGVLDINKLLELKFDCEQLLHSLIQFQKTFNLFGQDFNSVFIKNKIDELEEYRFRLDQKITELTAYEEELRNELVSEFIREQLSSLDPYF